MKINEVIELVNDNPKKIEENIKTLFSLNEYKMIVSTSSGINSAVILDILNQLELNIEVVFINTGFLFNETLNYFRYLKEKYRYLSFKEIFPGINNMAFIEHYGNDIMKKNPDLCCKINKIDPLNDYFTQFEKKIIWISGLRQSETEYRKKLNNQNICDYQNGLEVMDTISRIQEQNK